MSLRRISFIMDDSLDISNYLAVSSLWTLVQFLMQRISDLLFCVLRVIGMTNLQPIFYNIHSTDVHLLWFSAPVSFSLCQFELQTKYVSVLLTKCNDGFPVCICCGRLILPSPIILLCPQKQLSLFSKSVFWNSIPVTFTMIFLFPDFSIQISQFDKKLLVVQWYLQFRH